MEKISGAARGLVRCAGLAAAAVLVLSAIATPTTGIIASTGTSTAGSTTRRPITTIITAAAGSSGPITARARSAAIVHGIATTMTGELDGRAEISLAL